MSTDICYLVATQIVCFDGSIGKTNVDVGILVVPGAFHCWHLEFVGYLLVDSFAHLSLLYAEDSQLSVPGGGGEVIGELS